MKSLSKPLVIQAVRNIFATNTYKVAGATHFKLPKSVSNVPYSIATKMGTYRVFSRELPPIRKARVLTQDTVTDSVRAGICKRQCASSTTESDQFIANAKTKIDDLFEQLPQLDAKNADLETCRQFLDSTLSTIYSSIKDSYHQNTILSTQDNSGIADKPNENQYLHKFGEIAKQAGLKGKIDDKHCFTPDGKGTNPFVNRMLSDVFHSDLMKMNDKPLKSSLQNYIVEKLISRHPDFVNETEKRLNKISNLNKLHSELSEQLHDLKINPEQAIKKRNNAKIHEKQEKEKELISRLEKLIETSPQKFKQDLENSL